MDPMKPNYVETQIPKPIPAKGEETPTPIKDRVVDKSVSDTVATNRTARHGRFYLKVIQPVCLYVLNKAKTTFGDATPVTRLSDRAIGYVGGLSERQQQALQSWVDKASPDERNLRMQAVERIEFCVEKGEKELSLDGLQLTSLPDMVGELSWLNILSCEDNELSELPESISSLSRLRQIYCKNNSLKSLPANFSDMKRLEVIQLTNNQLESYPNGLSNLKRLEVFDCTGNRLKTFSPELLECTNLYQVYLGRNQISEVPSGLNRLRNLQQLHLSFNRFQTIPEQLTEIRNPEFPCKVYLQGNAFVVEDVLEWKQSHSMHNSLRLLAQKRMSVAVAKGNSLEKNIQNWFSMAGELMPADLMDAFDDPSVATAITLHLQKLVATRDYKEGTFAEARTMAQRVTALLQEMAADEDVMNACVAASVEAVESCQDRALLGLNDMELATRIVKAEKKGGVLELVKLQRDIYVKKLVEELADTRFAEIEKEYEDDLKSGKSLTVEQRRKPDQIEVRLAYLLGLQEKLDLPIESGQQMKWGWYSRITDEDLDKAHENVAEKLSIRTDEQVIDSLLEWKVFSEELEQDYFGYIQDIGDKYVELMTDEYSNLNEWEFENLSRLMAQQQELEKKDFLRLPRLWQGILYRQEPESNIWLSFRILEWC
ncbi:leucine-rich repeat domain-containing protein [Endozoicomonas arenosclerae]|uniref:leucine-rich repeat domain-containing protein n=1 Tax=Endozoicomonas arenosclerae TaxID=1633495 RepID=UPI000782AB3C|nr:NEL-type E3 ubiquitin ligase domain-containing protein [Endozoicomonas arenosclerae]